MADLQVCYFCGSGPDGSLGEYAVVPPGLDPTDDQQLSVVLCPDCRGKLTTVMEPMVEAAESSAGMDAKGHVGEGGAGERHPGDGSDGDGTAGEDGAADAAAGVDSPGSDAGVGDRTAAEGPVESGGADDPVTDAATGDDRGSTDAGAHAGGGDEVDVPPTAEATGGDDEVSIDPSGERASDADGPDEQPGAAPVDDSPGDVEPDPTPSPDQTPPHADDELVGRNNAAYNKTLRLLQNREFPVERHEIEQVAANAYQLDPQEVSDAIDSLIQKGLLSQEGAHLRRP